MSQRSGYALFLMSHATVLPAVEHALELAGIGQLLADWGSRVRRTALLSDLTALGLRAPMPLPVPSFEGTATLLGAAYVLEGSRIGGALLLRRAQASGDPAIQAATAYLSHGQGQGLWASFLDILEASGPAREFPEQLAEGARATFAAFEAAALATSRPEVNHVELAS